ncbi:MAG: hypothetical protein MJ162_08835, partial [Treponema sp.]|nr:hypothetical protein [Treponema sp.]
MVLVFKSIVIAEELILQSLFFGTLFLHKHSLSELVSQLDEKKLASLKYNIVSNLKKKSGCLFAVLLRKEQPD